MSKAALYPEGHFYSPIVDTDEASRDADRIWPGLKPIAGIDLREDRQRILLAEHFPALLKQYDFPLEGPRDEGLSFYYEHNSQFAWLDSRALFCLLRMIKPQKIVEVGSGYSTLLMSEVNETYLHGAAAIHCIEPYPRAFLVNGAKSGRYTLHTQRAQDVSMSLWASLGENDLLFIDSSHVCKTGSDVTHLMLNVLPRLNHGVYVHIHDVFLPEDYRRDWVIDENRSWNEQYLLQALLVENPNFEVIFGSYYVYRRFPELVTAATGHTAYGGSSFWIRRVGVGEKGSGVVE